MGSTRAARFAGMQTASDDEVYVRPFPGPGGIQKISTTGGRGPVWLSDRALAFPRLGTRIMELAVLDVGTAVQVVERRELFDQSPYKATQGAVHYDVSRDGEQFLMLLQEGGDGPVAPVVVLNWFEEIKRRAAEQGSKE